MLAKPTIADAFAEYLAERDKPTKARSYTLKRSIVELFESYMDSYAYESLAKDEEAFWRRRWDQDEEKNSFSRTFGPERLLETIGAFLGWFIIRKVMGGPEISEAAGPETLELLEWLEAKGYVKPGRGLDDAKEIARDAADELPRAQKLSSLLYDVTRKRAPRPWIEDLDLDADPVTISKIEPGRLWFTTFEGDEIGPLAVPAKANELAVVGWEVSATHFVRSARGWHLIEIGNVYPR
jgi:hypothetical protein